VAKLVAEKLGYLYVDTGAMYRLLTYLMIKNNVEMNEDEKINDLLVNEFDYEIINGRMICNGEDVTDKIRGKEVNEIVTFVAGKQYVRNFLVDLQKNIAGEKGVVMDGRDITSVVLKDAELKIYLDADFEERVKRRLDQELKKGKNSTYEEVKKIIELRDYNDIKNNKTLVKSADSIVVDTTYTTVEEAVEKVYELAKERISNG
jgi:cytidylate kinase